MSSLFNTILYQPILHTLIFIYNNTAFQSLGLSIIIMTALIRIVLFPLFYKQAETQAVMQKLQPKLTNIQKTHKDDKEKQMKETMKLYKDNKVNPFSSILVLIIQLPILIGLYRVLLQEIPGAVFDNAIFLSFIDLSVKSIPIAIIAAILQFIHAKMTMAKRESSKDESPAEKVGRIMVFIAPAITLLILTSLPAALGVYWITSTIFSIGQQAIVHKKIKEREGNDIIKTK